MDKLLIQWPARLDAANIEQGIKALQDALDAIQRDTVTLVLQYDRTSSFIVPRQGPFRLLDVGDVLEVTKITRAYGEEEHDS